MKSNIGIYDVIVVALGAVALWAVTGYVITSIVLSACFYLAGMLFTEWLIDRIIKW
jgi:hypothetical protein